MNNRRSKIVPKKNKGERIELEHGTISALTDEMRTEGVNLTYTAIRNRIIRRSHPDTIRRALEVSARISAARAERNAEIRKIIEQAHREAHA